MASFYCTLSPVDGDGTQLSVYARFTGGASDYTYKRSIDIASRASGHSRSIRARSAVVRAPLSARSQGSHRARHTSGYATCTTGADRGSSQITAIPAQPRHTAAAAAEAVRRRSSTSGRMPIRTGRDTARSSTLGRITTQIGYRFDRSTITGAIRNPIGGKEHE